MTITTYNVLTGLAYITLVIIAIIVSWKKGEKEGSVFALSIRTFTKDKKRVPPLELNALVWMVHCSKHLKMILKHYLR